MAGALTITTQNPMRGPGRPVQKLTLAWTSDASGNVSGNLTDYVSGQIVRVVFVPGAAGSQPTNLYDLVLLDQNALDVLNSLGANLSNATTTQETPGVTLTDNVTTAPVAVTVDDKLELQVSNAGNAKSGTVVLYVR